MGISTIKFIEKYEWFINLVLKPVFMLGLGVAISYNSLYLNSKYVQLVPYNASLQLTNDKIDTDSLEINTKLDTVLRNQDVFADKLSNLKDTVQDNANRIQYLERERRDGSEKSNP